MVQQQLFGPDLVLVSYKMTASITTSNQDRGNIHYSGILDYLDKTILKTLTLKNNEEEHFGISRLCSGQLKATTIVLTLETQS